jgi:coenzyme Q-binding protein COQ10
MAEATKTAIMSIPVDKLWQTIVEYEKYPEFVEGAQTVKVLSREGQKSRVEYKIELLGKDIFYVLDHIEESPTSMKWSLVESNILKSNSGGWVLKSKGDGQTEATYSLNLDFKIYVPGIVLSGLVKSSLPKLLESFEKRAKGK